MGLVLRALLGMAICVVFLFFLALDSCRGNCGWRQIVGRSSRWVGVYGVAGVASFAWLLLLLLPAWTLCSVLCCPSEHVLTTLDASEHVLTTRDDHTFSYLFIPGSRHTFSYLFIPFHTFSYLFIPFQIALSAV